MPADAFTAATDGMRPRGAGAGFDRGTVVELLQRRSRLTTVLQPILSLRDQRPIGFEALLRLPDDCGFADPEELFHAAVGSEWLIDLEMAALDTHLRSARHLRDGRLFLNFSAPAFLDRRMHPAALSSRVRAAGFAPERVVLELTELVRIANPSRFAAALQPLREEGFPLAVDDFGAGFTNLQLFIELSPDYVKIDRSLVIGACGDARKRAFLEFLGTLGRRVNCAVIAEGIESLEDLAAVRASGIAYAQGYAIAVPSESGLENLVEVPALAAPSPLASAEEPIGALSLPQEGVQADTLVAALMHPFEGNDPPIAIPVLDGCRPIGLVTGQSLFYHLGHRYGFAIWHERRAAEFIDANGMGFDRLPAHSCLEDAAEVVRRRPSARRFDPIVVVDEREHYHGLLPVDLLLNEMTRLKVEYALQANPLSGLPGTVALGRAVERRIGQAAQFALGWVDIDHFKPFNDYYGFNRGDQVLLLLCEILRTHLGRVADDFLAHPGGDDFAFLTRDEGAQERAEALVREFGDRVVSCYDDEDRDRGGITTIDRQGRSRWFEMLSLSIGMVVWRGEPGCSFRQLVEIAAETKGAAKRKRGPAVVVNARALSSPPR